MEIVGEYRQNNDFTASRPGRSFRESHPRDFLRTAEDPRGPQAITCLNERRDAGVKRRDGRLYSATSGRPRMEHGSSGPLFPPPADREKRETLSRFCRGKRKTVDYAP